jgi:hypothetical protein
MKSYHKVEAIKNSYDKVDPRFHWYSKEEMILFYGRIEGVISTISISALIYGGVALIKKVKN